eukprot:gb/GFBE01023022.1/.p1 GENE.gb/GFBE01023022.1/~~gb/GFBE01023022.1/.p1  ORF type:complete len:1387 (+),score=330.79 gb/GFBE01023022.1/:1-4161(+)
MAEAAQLLQWAEETGVFVKPGETPDAVQVKGRRDAEPRSVTVPGNKTKSKLWVCRFCGESCSGAPRSIRQHLTKPAVAAPKKGGGCSQVTVEALQELICFGVDEAAEKVRQVEEESNRINDAPQVPEASGAEPVASASAKRSASEAKSPGKPRKASKVAAASNADAEQAQTASPKKRSRTSTAPPAAPVEDKRGTTDKKGKSEKKNKKDKDKDSRKDKDEKKEKKDQAEKNKETKQVETPAEPPQKASAGVSASKRKDEAQSPVPAKRQKDAVTGPKPGAAKAPEPSAFKDDEEDEDWMNNMMEEEHKDVLDSIDGPHGESMPEARLVAEPSVVEKIRVDLWEDQSSKVEQTVSLRPQQVEFLQEQKPGGSAEGPNWLSLLACVSGAKLSVIYGEDAAATIAASTPQARRRAVLLLSKALEFNANGGVAIDSTRRHNFMTVMNWEPGLLAKQEQWLLADLSVRHQVVILPAKQQGSEVRAFQQGGVVEVYQAAQHHWAPAKLVSDPFSGSARVSFVGTYGSEQEVPIQNLRQGCDRIAILGDRKSRALVQLALAAQVWKANAHVGFFDFGPNAAAALGKDDSWGTYRRVFEDKYFVEQLASSNRLDKVLQPASGCALNFLGSMAFATGSLEERACARAMLEALLQASNKFGRLPPMSEAQDRRWNLDVEVSRNSIKQLLTREQTEICPEEEKFKVLILVAEAAQDPRGNSSAEEAQTFEVGAEVEVSYQGRWFEAVVEDKREEDLGNVRVRIRKGDSVVVSPQEVRPPSEKKTICIFGFDAWRRECASLHFRALSAESAGDGGQAVLQELRNFKSADSSVATEFLEPPHGSTADLCKQVGPRVARASRCGFEVVAGMVVLHGNQLARERARRVLAWAVAQRGDPTKELVLEKSEEATLRGVELNDAEKRAASAEIIQKVERETDTFLFLLDDWSQQKYKCNEKIEFRWADEGEPPEDEWYLGTFVRPIIGRKGEVKVSYVSEEEGAKPEEWDVNLKYIRPDSSRRQPPKMLVFHHGAGDGTSAMDIDLVAKLLKALLRDAVGRVNTGQAWFKDGKGKGKDGKGKGKDGKGKGKDGKGKGKDGKGKGKSDDSSKGGGGRGKQPCFSFQKGNCRDGENCRYSHDVPQTSDGGNWGGGKKACFKFQQGHCPFGDSCQYSHDVAQTSDAGSSRGGDAGGGASNSWEKRGSSQRDSWNANSRGGRDDGWQNKSSWSSNSNQWSGTSWRDNSWGGSTGSGNRSCDQGGGNGSWGEGGSTAASAASVQANLAVQAAAPQVNQLLQATLGALGGALGGAVQPALGMQFNSNNVESAQREAAQLEIENAQRWASLTPNDIPVNVAQWQMQQETFFPGASILPNGWIRVLSKKSRKMYYMNVNNVQTTYQVSVCFN